MSNKKPTHIAYTVRNYGSGKNGNDKAEWLKIGVAFMHGDGKGLDLTLEAVPVDGRVVMRLNEPKPKAEA